MTSQCRIGRTALFCPCVIVSPEEFFEFGGYLEDFVASPLWEMSGFVRDLSDAWYRADLAVRLLSASFFTVYGYLVFWHARFASEAQVLRNQRLLWPTVGLHHFAL